MALMSLIMNLINRIYYHMIVGNNIICNFKVLHVVLEMVCEFNEKREEKI